MRKLPKKKRVNGYDPNVTQVICIPMSNNDILLLDDIDFILECSIKNGYMVGVEIAIKEGVDIHKWDERALRFAIEYDKKDIIQYLIECGANLADAIDFIIKYHYWLDYSDGYWMNELPNDIDIQNRRSDLIVSVLENK